jgi:site-specific DNA-methyltransferase (adenine-specific)
MRYSLYCGDCKELIPNLKWVNCVFADPPDNINTQYNTYKDKLQDNEYIQLFRQWIYLFIQQGYITWLSFNSKWTFAIGNIVYDLIREADIEVKPCVQTFTFGQHSHTDLGNNYRQLWRLKHPYISKIYPDHIRVPSWRQQHGDKRADPRGRVPGDVFDFPRVVGNSKQRRSWHPTQLHEDLVERCIKLSTREGETVLDPFAGTGTVLRVCRRINRRCISIEIDRDYCERIAEENGLIYSRENFWSF